MTFKQYFTLLIINAFFFISSANATITGWKDNEGGGAKTRILTSFYEDENGNKKLITGMEFHIAKGWKIYGNSADGIGLPPSFTVQDSITHTVIWPEAHQEEEHFGTEVLKYTTYKDNVILPIEIDFKDGIAPSTLSISIHYGLCKDICIPASENFSIPLSHEIDEDALHLIEDFYPKEIIKSSDESQSDNTVSTLISAIILALIGGAILNIMPCVLPVLSIKLMSVITHSDAQISRIRFAFFSTICGILLCFLFFASAAVAIKLTGNSLGWGLQFQNPYFLIFLILILVLLSGNLLGIFNISFDQFLATLLNKKITEKESEKNIFIPNFLSGILAVLLATPCSAPFLGSAISFALTQNVTIIFIMFFAIGIGFCAPYIAVLIAPKMVHLLPKPGNWMFTIKKLMAVFLMLTTLWLTYTLAHNIGMIPAFIATCIAIALLFSLKIKTNFLKLMLLICLTTTVFCLPINLQKTYQDIASESSQNELWMEFNEESLHGLVSQGFVVVVDVTADWCLTCKLNKVRVLDTDEITQTLKGKNIIAMRADITKPNEAVMGFLRKHDRFAIPFNAVYGPNAKDGLLTSEFLRKEELLTFIQKAKQ